MSVTVSVLYVQLTWQGLSFIPHESFENVYFCSAYAREVLKEDSNSQCTLFCNIFLPMHIIILEHLVH